MKKTILLLLQLLFSTTALLAQPVIDQQPMEQVITNSDTAMFSVSASGSGPLTYQWLFNGANIGPLITTVAGNGTTGFSGDGGPATNATMHSPQGLAVDSAGNVLIADFNNHVVRKMNVAGVITTVAGIGVYGFSGDGSLATNASLNHPAAVAVDGIGNLYIADQDNHRVRKVGTNGVITTIAGNGTAGFSGDGGVATNASMLTPMGLALDAAGNVFIADYDNHRVRQVGTNGIITTVAGNGADGYSGDRDAATNSSLGSPFGVAVDSAGNLYIGDPTNNCVRKVDTAGIITTVAGNGSRGFWGDGGPAVYATLSVPCGVAIDAMGNLLLADAGNHRVRAVDTNGIITTLAGSGVSGFSGDGNLAAFGAMTYPVGVAVDPSGNVLIADEYNHRVRRLYAWPETNAYFTLPNITTNNIGDYSVVVTDAGGNVTSSAASLNMPPYISTQLASQTIAWGGSAAFAPITGGSLPLTYRWSLNGTNLSSPTKPNLTITNATLTNGGSYVLTVTNLYGRAVSSTATVTVVNISPQPTNFTSGAGGTASFSVQMPAGGPFTFRWQLNGINLATNGIISTVAGDGSTNFAGDGGLATSASLSTPHGSAVDSAGNVYIADYGYNRVRKVNLAGIITTCAGNGANGFLGDGGTATNAALAHPAGVALDNVGHLFIADYGNHRIRMVDTNGVITAYAGNGTVGFSGDGAPATNAALYYPSGVAVDNTGNLFIADSNNNCIRKVDTNGTITTVVGTNSAGFAGDGGLATSATLNQPAAVAVDAQGNLFIADNGNYRVRKVDTNGFMSTLAGNGISGFSGDGGLATNARISPDGVAVDNVGNVFIADYSNYRIREVYANGTITTIAGNGILNNTDGGVIPTTASIYYARGVSVDRANTIYIADDYRLRKIVGNPLYPPTQTTLAVPNLSAANAGNYTVVIRSPSGTITSLVATLTIQAPPIISVHPASQVVGVGSSPRFSLAALGSGPLGYGLLVGGTNLLQSGTSSTITLNNVSTNDSGAYAMVVTNPWGSATSQLATLTVLLPPTITVQPVGQTNRAGTTTTFRVTPGGVGPFSYQWRFESTNIQNNLITTLTNVPQPYGLTFDAGGNLFIACYDHRIRKYDANGSLSVVAGTGAGGYSGDGGQATNATFWELQDLVFDKAGNLYIADIFNSRVRKVSTNGIVTTIAGDGGNTTTGDGGPATLASIADVSGIAWDNTGNLLITCFAGARVRQIDTNGIITTVAGNGVNGYSGDGGAALNAALGHPQDVAVDAIGNLFIGDYVGRVRRVDTTGIITTFAGKSTGGYSGDGGPATNALLNDVGSVKFDRVGNLIIADMFNNRVRRVDTNGVITTIAGKGTAGSSGDGGSATNATLYMPAGLAIDGAGNLFIADFNNNRIREVHFGGFPSFTISNISLKNAGNYSVIVSSPYGSVTSSIATLSIPPYIVTQPSNQKAAVGNSATFSVLAQGTPLLSYQWWINRTPQTNAAALLLTGQTSNALTVSPVYATNEGSYFVVVSNYCGSVTSALAALTVFFPPQNFLISSLAAGGVNLQFLGTPNYPYTLQSATNLTPPVVWQPVLTSPADTNGNWQFSDPNVDLGQRYYRAMGQ